MDKKKGVIKKYYGLYISAPSYNLLEKQIKEMLRIISMEKYTDTKKWFNKIEAEEKTEVLLECLGTKKEMTFEEFEKIDLSKFVLK